MSTNTMPILALVGAELVCLLAYVGSCELRAKDAAACENRWAMALPAIALAGQSAATYFMDSGRSAEGPSSNPHSPGPGSGVLHSLPPRNRQGRFLSTRPGNNDGEPAA